MALAELDLGADLGKVRLDSGGMGQQAMLDRAPEPLGFSARNWEKAGGELAQLRLIKAPLRLRWMVDQDWQPGLWTRDDLRADDRKRRRRGPLLLGRF